MVAQKRGSKSHGGGTGKKGQRRINLRGVRQDSKTEYSNGFQRDGRTNSDHALPNIEEMHRVDEKSMSEQKSGRKIVMSNDEIVDINLAGNSDKGMGSIDKAINQGHNFFNNRTQRQDKSALVPYGLQRIQDLSSGGQMSSRSKIKHIKKIYNQLNFGNRPSNSPSKNPYFVPVLKDRNRDLSI